MGRFYGGRRLGLDMSRPVPGGPVSPGGVVPSAPAVFPPYQIHPQVIGGPVPSGLLRSTGALFPQGQSVVPVNAAAHPAVQKALNSDVRALNARAKAEVTQRAADVLAHDAIKAGSKAAVDPDAQLEAVAKALKARRADEAAARAKWEADRHEEQADRDAAKAHELIDQRDGGGGGGGFTEPYPDQYGPPGLLPGDPGVYLPSTTTGDTVKTVAFVTGGAAAGFLAFGPLGALIGAAGMYFARR